MEPDSEVNGVLTPENMSEASVDMRGPVPRPHQSVPPQGTMEQRERTLRDERQAFEDRVIATERHFERREQAHAESRRELDRCRREIQGMHADFNEEMSRREREHESKIRDWQLKKDDEEEMIRRQQRMSREKIQAEWKDFEERKAADMKAWEEEEKKEQRKVWEEMASINTSDSTENQLTLQEYTAQVAELQELNEQLQLSLKKAQERVAELEAQILRNYVAPRGLNEEPETITEETERQMSAEDDQDAICVQQRAEVPESPQTYDVSYSSSRGAGTVTVSAVITPCRAISPRVVPPPEPEEPTKTLVMPSSASGKFPFSSTTEEFINMLQDYTGVKYELEVKSGEDITADDVVALPFSGSGPFHQPALTRAMKEANIQDKQHVIALGVFTTRRTRSQAWRFTTYNNIIPVVYVAIHGHGQLVQASNATTVCKLVGNKLEEYYGAVHSQNERREKQDKTLA